MPVNTNLTNVVGDYVPIGGGTMTGNLTLNDDIVALFGTGGTVSLLYETADANANALIFVAPEGGGTDVPAFIFGDASILNSDLGWFNGLTEPSLVVVNDAKDAYIRIDAGDDAVAGSQGVYFKAAADEDIELLNLSVTGTPRVYWDESEDQFRSTKGWVFDAACDVQGTWVASAAWTIPAVTLGGTVTLNAQTLSGNMLLGVGAAALGSPLTDAGTSVLNVYRTTTDTDSIQAIGEIEARSSGDMADGFGAGFEFYVGDAAAPTNWYGLIGAVRAGADNEGNLVFYRNTGGAVGLMATFGDANNFANPIQIAGTQVVGARVVDARADDVANSGDATTDGLIDALRDAMITHGLIAAA